MIPIHLLISLISIIISIIAYRISKAGEKKSKIYVSKLKDTQIKNYKLYNFVRQKRNSVRKQKLYCERSMSRNFDAYICSLTAIEEQLMEIEEYMQNENLV